MLLCPRAVGLPALVSLALFLGACTWPQAPVHLQGGLGH